MPVEAATNCWTNAEDQLAETLPLLAEFLVLTGEDDADAAATHVFWEQSDEPQDLNAVTREEREERGTIAVVYSEPTRPYKITTGPDHAYFGQGRLVLAIERPVKKTEWELLETENIGRGQVNRWFKNRVGTLANQLIDYWMVNGGPYIRSIEFNGPLETDPEEWDTLGRLQLIEIAIEWGLNVAD